MTSRRVLIQKSRTSCYRNGKISPRTASTVTSLARVACRKAPPNVEWPHVTINEGLENYRPDALAAVWRLLQRARGWHRPGAQRALQLWLEHRAAALWRRGLRHGRRARDAAHLAAAQRQGRHPPADRRGRPRPEHRLWRARCWRWAVAIVEIARQYPKIGKYVFIYHPDLQGPMDICEVVWGSTIFYAAYDEPELVKAVAGAGHRDLYRLSARVAEDRALPPGRQRALGALSQGQHHAARRLGDELLRRDVRGVRRAPTISACWTQFGGGAIHFCGKGDHYICAPGADANSSTPSICRSRSITTWRPCLQNTVDKGIKLLDLTRDAAEAAVAAGRDLHGQVHCREAGTPTIN